MSNLDLDYFENVIIYKSLTDSGYLAAIADYVKPEFFKNSAITRVFAIVKEFVEERDCTPTPTEIKAKLESDKDRAAFNTLVKSFGEIDRNFNNDELYENTERFLKEKAVYHTMLEVASEISAGELNTSSILTSFEESCNINLVTDLGLNLYGDISSVIDDLNATESYISTGWPWLDDCLDGGFREVGKALYVFAGETNIGKSIFLGNIAHNIARQGKNVLIVTLEMSELLYARRICSDVSKIPLRELSTNEHSLREAINDQKGGIYIKEFPPSTITPNQLKAFIQKFGEQGIKLDCIVIDYINLLHSTMGTNSYERVKYVTEQLRAMSYVFGCPVVSATQLNRSGFDVDNPGTDTISESIGLAATADALISIFQNAEDREMEIIRIGMMKNRFGVRGVVRPMSIDYTTLTITEAEDLDEYGDGDDEGINTLAALAN